MPGPAQPQQEPVVPMREPLSTLKACTLPASRSATCSSCWHSCSTTLQAGRQAGRRVSEWVVEQIDALHAAAVALGEPTPTPAAAAAAVPAGRAPGQWAVGQCSRVGPLHSPPVWQLQRLPHLRLVRQLVIPHPGAAGIKLGHPAVAVAICSRQRGGTCVSDRRRPSLLPFCVEVIPVHAPLCAAAHAAAVQGARCSPET